AAGIDMSDVTDKLLRDGIEKFVEPYDKLIAGIESIREAVLTGRPKAIESSLPADLEQAIAERARRAEAESVAKRVWAKDESLWGGPGVAEIADRLGWLTICDEMLEQVDDLTDFAAELRDAGFTDA